MAPQVSASEIVALHDEWTRTWHVTPPQLDSSSLDTFLGVVCRQHFANFELWHEEDKARTPGAPDAQLAGVKRKIDRINQFRNDLMELCDDLLLGALASHGLPQPDARLHSESVGLMIDRLSILSLKIYHTKEEIERHNPPPGHVERNLERLAILEEQRRDLARALDEFWDDVLAGRGAFKVYRQLKMYNEPSLNPCIYQPDPHRRKS